MHWRQINFKVLRLYHLLRREQILYVERNAMKLLNYSRYCTKYVRVQGNEFALDQYGGCCTWSLSEADDAWRCYLLAEILLWSWEKRLDALFPKRDLEPLSDFLLEGLGPCELVVLVDEEEAGGVWPLVLGWSGLLPFEEPDHRLLLWPEAAAAASGTWERGPCPSGIRDSFFATEASGGSFAIDCFTALNVSCEKRKNQKPSHDSTSTQQTYSISMMTISFPVGFRLH